ncbi:MAG TPA: hypothetical protein VM901_08200 [Bdellovibrionota bacterium]|jgi:hypothetical protein|nr:hypothetical protein [Bdellovibrionota bacterium]
MIRLHHTLNILVISGYALFSVPLLHAESENPCKRIVDDAGAPAAQAYDATLLGEGAIVVVKENSRTPETMRTLISTLPEKGMVVYLGEMLIDKVFTVPPGGKLTMIRGPHKLDGRINVVRVRSEDLDLEGYVYVSEFKSRITIETPVAIAPKAAKAPKPKFPKLDYEGYGPSGETPRVGDLVWMWTHTRLMSLSNVGRITELTGERSQMVWVETLDGQKKWDNHDRIFLLPPDTLKTTVEHYGANRVNVDWLEGI